MTELDYETTIPFTSYLGRMFQHSTVQSRNVYIPQLYILINMHMLLLKRKTNCNTTFMSLLNHEYILHNANGFFFDILL